MDSLKDRLEQTLKNQQSAQIEGNNNGSTSPDHKSNGSFEETGFNIIKMIKIHLSHGVPLMFHVTLHYAKLRRGTIGRLVFWILAYIGQLIDMIFSAIHGFIMVIVALIVVVAIARAVGILDFISEFKTVLGV